MSTLPAISRVVHDKNLAVLADIERRELLEAIKYERNYSPITWFKTVPIAPRTEVRDDLRKMRDGKVERLKLTSNHFGTIKQRRELEAEIRWLDKKLLEGKQ